MCTLKFFMYDYLKIMKCLSLYTFFFFQYNMVGFLFQRAKVEKHFVYI
ncbi:unnamed protein product [Acanthoscelides obtectus]|uniref:Uncharacterized protein n=1 Tax=Acanthoscelides obtectus TaxID=200917 RepID=A0A9P0KDA8_ACAOB|nr:unnamed protein product [Acanthoscelides obtectus]CAK1635726.1 hypothetical protein AOBTE_LOCUS9466 [Acanthoscelides obtectus]